MQNHRNFIAPAPAWPLLHRTANLFGRLFSIIPRKWRFDVALRAARLFEPLIARTAMCRRQAALGIDRPQEICAYVVLNALTRVGVEFDLRIRHEGPLPSLGAGLLIACPHALLLYGMMRDLYDRGIEFDFVAAAPQKMLGTSAVHGWIPADRETRKQVSSRLESNKIVCAMIDRGEAWKSTSPFEIGGTVVHISDVLLKTAVDAGAEIIFCTARIDGSEIAVTWRKGTTLPAFVGFARSELASVRLAA